MKSRILMAVAVAVLVALTHECLLNATGGPKLTVRVSPLVRLTRGDARGVVTVPRHADNRMLRVVLESEDLLHPQRIARSTAKMQRRTISSIGTCRPVVPCDSPDL
jgi:hypothetical protein